MPVLAPLAICNALLYRRLPTSDLGTSIGMSEEPRQKKRPRPDPFVPHFPCTSRSVSAAFLHARSDRLVSYKR